jgi:phosphatidylglycerophosphatase C
VTSRVIAAFDFDGTITRRDTLVPFVARAMGPRAALQALRRLPGLVAGAGPWRDRVKVEIVAGAAGGKAVEDLEAAGRDYSERLPNLYRSEVVERIEWHRRQGHELVLVTASLGVYARPAGEALGFGRVLAVELESEADVYTGRLVGSNVRGPEKSRLLRSLIGDDDAETWAYGNSSGDAEMLAMADHPTWIRRGRTARGRTGREAT